MKFPQPCGMPQFEIHANFVVSQVACLIVKVSA